MTECDTPGKCVAQYSSADPLAKLKLRVAISVYGHIPEGSLVYKDVWSVPCDSLTVTILVMDISMIYSPNMFGPPRW